MADEDIPAKTDGAEIMHRICTVAFVMPGNKNRIVQDGKSKINFKIDIKKPASVKA